MKKLRLAFAVVATIASAVSAAAQGYPTPKEGDWVARDFLFHTGEVLSELRMHYTTVGEPTGEPVLILHGTTQSGTAHRNRSATQDAWLQWQRRILIRWEYHAHDFLGWGAFPLGGQAVGRHAPS
jgi:hypothetical protein